MVEFRRSLIFVLCLALSLGAGIKLVGAAEMGATMASVATDGPMPHPCSGCPSDGKTMSIGSCVAYCSGVVAVLPFVPAVMSVQPISLAFALVAPIAGKSIPPDPGPPRPLGMS